MFSKLLAKPRLVITAQLFGILTIIHQTQVEKASPPASYLLIAVIAYAVFVDTTMLTKPILWFALALLYILNPLSDWYQPSNHHFLFFYIFIALGLTFLNTKDRDSIFQTNANCLLVAVLFFAALQKALSAEYMDGSFFAYLLSTGSFFKPLYYFSVEAKLICKENISSLLKFIYHDPNTFASIRLKEPFSYHPTLAFIFTYKVLLVETLIPALWVILKERPIKHLMLIAFAIGTFTCVPETGFLSMIMALGFSQCSEKFKKTRTLYLVSIAIFALLIILQVGRP